MSNNVRPSVTIFAVFTILQSFGQAFGGAAAWFVGSYYRFPVPDQLAGWITVLITVPLQLAVIYIGVKKEWIKIG